MLHRIGNATANARYRLDAIAHLAIEGKAEGVGAGGLRPETALEAIAVLAASSLPEAIALRGRAIAPDLENLPAEGIDLEAHIEATVRRLMQEALDRCDGVQTKAAKLRGMSFRSFRYFRQKYGLDRSAKQDPALDLALPVEQGRESPPLRSPGSFYRLFHGRVLAEFRHQALEEAAGGSAKNRRRPERNGCTMWARVQESGLNISGERGLRL